jgi:hypothetical protein
VFGLASSVWSPLKVVIGSVTTSRALMLGGVALRVLPSLVVGNKLLILGVVGVAVGGRFLAHRHGHLRGMDGASTAAIRQHAVLTFVSTAISQNGKLDAAAVAVTNIRLVQRLVKHFGYRPQLFELVRIYGQVFVAAAIADGVNDLDVEGGLSQLGLGALDAIPGSRLLIDSAFDGAINALFTLRVGFVTRQCLLNAGKTFVRSEVRQAANREARFEMKSVLREAIPAVPAAMKGLIEKWL